MPPPSPCCPFPLPCFPHPRRTVYAYVEALAGNVVDADEAVDHLGRFVGEFDERVVDELVRGHHEAASVPRAGLLGRVPVLGGAVELVETVAGDVAVALGRRATLVRCKTVVNLSQNSSERARIGRYLFLSGYQPFSQLVTALLSWRGRKRERNTDINKN